MEPTGFFRNVGSTNERCVTSHKSAGLKNYIYKEQTFS